MTAQTCPRHVGKGYSNQETRDKLQAALQAAEWLQSTKTTDEQVGDVAPEKSEVEDERNFEEYIKDTLMEAVDKNIKPDVEPQCTTADDEINNTDETTAVGKEIEEEMREVADWIVERALDNAFDGSQGINVEEANTILDNAVELVDKLISIGNLPLTQEPCSFEIGTECREEEDIPESSNLEIREESDNEVIEEKTETSEEIIIPESLPDTEVEEFHEQPSEEHSTVKVYEKNIAKSLELQIVDKDNSE